MYKKLKNEFSGALSGKGLEFGGSFGRVEATGYGAVYFAEKMLNSHNDTLKGKKVAISGAGNVAFHVIQKLYDYGAIPITCSDSKGFIYDESGINLQLLTKLLHNLSKFVNLIKNPYFRDFNKIYKRRYR
jgi:glutamate dehydrogenase (NADP+)